MKIDKGGVATDAKLRTSDPAIWAAGDIAYAHNPAADRHLRVEHWGEAEAMGEIVGANLAGEHQRWAVAPGFWSTIGDHQLKYSAWGDGFDRADLVEGPEGWAVWYSCDGSVVGVLAENWDSAYERGQSLLERRQTFRLGGHLDNGWSRFGTSRLALTFVTWPFVWVFDVPFVVCPVKRLIGSPLSIATICAVLVVGA